MSAGAHTLDFAARAMKGTILEAGARGPSFAGAAADSRAVEAEQLFFALPGERVDGFDFVAAGGGFGRGRRGRRRARAACRRGARTPRSSPSTIRAARSAIWPGPSGPNFAVGWSR